MSPVEARRGPSSLAAAGWIALLCVLWGSTCIVIRGGLDDLPPFTSAAVRFSVSGLAMRVVAARFARRKGGAKPPSLLWIALGTLNFASSYAIVYWAAQHLPSGLERLLWGSFPLIMALAAHCTLPGEKHAGAQWLGFALGFVG